MQPSVIINGQTIPWSFIQQVRKLCGYSWDLTIDCFWKARNATGPAGVIKYIVRGLKPDAKNNRYSLLPSKEWESGAAGQEKVRQWWANSVYQPKKGPVSIADIFAEIAAGTNGRPGGPP